MDEYYQNEPLPTWIGWYVQHLPHRFQAATTGATLAMELGLIFMLFFPRRVRLICFCIVTPWQIGVTLTEQLHVPELFGAFPRLLTAGRSGADADCADAVQTA